MDARTDRPMAISRIPNQRTGCFLRSMIPEKTPLPAAIPTRKVLNMMVKA